MCINIVIITFWKSKSNRNTQGQTLHTLTHSLTFQKLKTLSRCLGKKKKKKNFGKSIQQLLCNINVIYKDATQSKNLCYTTIWSVNLNYNEGNGFKVIIE